MFQRNNLLSLAEVFRTMPEEIRKKIDGWDYYVESTFSDVDTDEEMVTENDVICFTKSLNSETEKHKQWQDRNTNISKNGLDELIAFNNKLNELPKRPGKCGDLMSWIFMPALPSNPTALPTALRTKLSALAAEYKLTLEGKSPADIENELFKVIGEPPLTLGEKVYRRYHINSQTLTAPATRFREVDESELEVELDDLIGESVSLVSEDSIRYR